ncbi:MAG: glycosyltransferase family 2 protein [bacterium]
MLNGKKIAVVLPGYNCGNTLEATYSNIPKELIDVFIYVDDRSNDNSIAVAKKLGINEIIRHKRNMGYGANQKTCYWAALKSGADVVVMIHPDYQYEPKLVLSMVAPIAYGIYDAMIGSRILGNMALSGGMPLYKYISNRFLTFLENILLNAKLSEYHTGYRAFDSKVLAELPIIQNSNDFVFDNEMLAQVLFYNYKIGEVSCPTKYFPEASSINFLRSITYGINCIITACLYRLAKFQIVKPNIFKKANDKESSLTNAAAIKDNFEIIATSGFLSFERE